MDAAIRLGRSASGFRKVSHETRYLSFISIQTNFNTANLIGRESSEYRLNDQVNERNHTKQLQDEPLRSLNYTAEIVDCLDELFRSGGQRAPPLKLKEHISDGRRSRWGCQGLRVAKDCGNTSGVKTGPTETYMRWV